MTLTPLTMYKTCDGEDCWRQSRKKRNAIVSVYYLVKLVRNQWRIETHH